MGQIKLISAMIMVALFSLAMVTFAVNFGVENNSSVQLIDDPDYASLNASVKTQIQEFNTESNTSSNTLFSTTQEQGDQSASSGGQFKVTTGSAITVVTSLITVGFKKIFGQDTGFGIFLTAITSMLLFMIGLYVWKSWKGNPD